MKVKSRHPHCEGKLKVFVTSRSTLKEWLKEVSETEKKWYKKNLRKPEGKKEQIMSK